MLTAQVRELGEAFNQNTAAYAEAFENIDARLAVMLRVINDMAKAELVRVNGSCDIDFPWYFMQYRVIVSVIRAIESLHVPPEQPAMLEPDEMTTVFGGDAPAAVG